MYKQIIILPFFLMGAMLQGTHAQGVYIWDEISEQTFTLWAQNNLPCPVYVKAEPDSSEQSFDRFLPRGSKEPLAQLPVDSLDDPDQFKGQIRYTLTLGDPDAIHDSRYQYLLPYPEGRAHILIQGNNSKFTHNQPSSTYAFDFDMPENSLISAARGGAVGLVNDENKEGGNNKNYLQRANKIMICHDDGTVALYAHLRHKGALVNIGDRVFPGQVIGFSGNTGYSTTPHLHFAVLAGSKSVPIKFNMLPDTLESGEFYEQNLDF